MQSYSRHTCMFCGKSINETGNCGKHLTTKSKLELGKYNMPQVDQTAKKYFGLMVKLESSVSRKLSKGIRNIPETEELRSILSLLPATYWDRIPLPSTWQEPCVAK